jgi:predicted glutamine amidotransferase
MCRLLLAHGEFDVRQMLAAAVGMSLGETADHNGPTQVHPNGWGAVWREGGPGGTLAFHRDPGPLFDGVHDSPLPSLRTDFLAIHSRHATISANVGLPFIHPLVRTDGSTTWYFMHNGFLPTVHRLLNLDGSRFDSAEYFEYAVPVGATALDEADLLARLRAIPPGGSSGNAIVVNTTDAYVIHWTPSAEADRRYFTMHTLETDRAVIVSSEVVPALGPPRNWWPVAPDRVLRIPLTISSNR